jgi:thymidylate synthase
VFWILAGRNDSKFINYWNKELPRFAGQDDNYHGAYGYRLRRQFGLDQLERAFTALDKNPDSRQIVLEIWDSKEDFPAVDGSPVSKDIPCNVCSMLKVRDGRLEWMQIMRSNDLFLGTPHNFVQFTMLQEIIAGWLGLDIGGYGHFSDSLHAYEVYDDEVDKYSIAQTVPISTNPDRLGLRKAESDIVLQKVMNISEMLTAPDLSITEFKDLCALDELPEGYRNLIFIMAADGARRRDWGTDMDRVASNCTNPALQTAWDGWRRRDPRFRGA